MTARIFSLRDTLRRVDSTGMRVLLIEDSRRLQLAVTKGLRQLGHGVDVAEDGESGERYACNNPYDVILLDLMLPKKSGLDVLTSLREKQIDTCVLILSAKDTVDERIEGLNRGADDYLIKPFAFEELAARIEALGRRRYGQGAPQLCFGPLTVDTAARQILVNDRALDLSAREFQLLAFLAQRADQVVSRIEIEDHLYDETSLPQSNAVDRLICSVRARLDDAGLPGAIRTRRGLGYCLETGSL